MGSIESFGAFFFELVYRGSARITTLNDFLWHDFDLRSPNLFFSCLHGVFVQIYSPSPEKGETGSTGPLRAHRWNRSSWSFLKSGGQGPGPKGLCFST
jgi:hypothetical protein